MSWPLAFLAISLSWQGINEPRASSYCEVSLQGFEGQGSGGIAIYVDDDNSPIFKVLWINMGRFFPSREGSYVARWEIVTNEPTVRYRLLHQTVEFWLPRNGLEFPLTVKAFGQDGQFWSREYTRTEMASTQDLRSRNWLSFPFLQLTDQPPDSLTDVLGRGVVSIIVSDRDERTITEHTLNLPDADQINDRVQAALQTAEQRRVDGLCTPPPQPII